MTEDRPENLEEVLGSIKSRCIGYGEKEGKCTEVAGTPWTNVWCTKCDEVRRAEITDKLYALVARIERRANA